MPNPSTNNSDMVVYNTAAQTGYVEGVQDNVDAFNAASLGCLVLNAENIVGDFKKEAFFRAETDFKWRDVNSNGTVDSTGISQAETVSVKLPWMLPPKSVTREALARVGHDESIFAYIMGVKTAESLVSYQVNHALKALLAASSSAGMTVKGNIEADRQKVITRALRKYGDKADRVKLLVMHSETYNDLRDATIDKVTYQTEGVVLHGADPAMLGRAVLVTDVCPVDKIFCLQPGAVTVTESQVPIFTFYPDYLHENIGLMYRGEGTFNLELMGYSYDVAQGENPKLDVIASPAAWKKVTISDKLLGGVIIDLAA